MRALMPEFPIRSVMDTYDSNKLMTPADVAAYLQKPVKTLANWRCLGVGPASIRVGGAVRYRKSDIELWLDIHTHSSIEMTRVPVDG